MAKLDELNDKEKKKGDFEYNGITFLTSSEKELNQEDLEKIFDDVVLQNTIEECILFLSEK